MSRELTTEADLHSFNTGENGENVYVAIHAGKNVEQTMLLVGLVYHFKANFYSGPIIAIDDELAPDIDTNCRILSSNPHSPLEPGQRIFDLACAYGPEKLVKAMMKHPDTPVGQVHGFLLGEHSALTFLAHTIADRHEIKSHENFNQHVNSRRSIFEALIADPRTPVKHRINTLEGGKTLDVLGILKRNDDAKGLAYYPIVSELLWQRKAAIATHWDFKGSMYEAFTASSDELVKDTCFQHMSRKEKKNFYQALQQDIDNQYGRTSLRARSECQSPGLGPEPLAWHRIDQRLIMQDISAINVQEAAAAKTSIARQIWMDCANLACLKNGLIGLFGKVGPDLHH